MISRRLLPLLLALAVSAASAAEPPVERSVVLDDNVWVTFYDLPSRRFRAIRTAILRRDHAAAAHDLGVVANYLSVEAERSSVTFQAPLGDVVQQLRALAANTDAITLDTLDALFARAHWLLSQHYLARARLARDAGDPRGAGLDLWATTHHLERAILWSDAPITRDVYKALEGLRDAAQRLQDPKRSARALRDKPLRRADRLLREIGEQLDRRVLLPPPATQPAGAA